jgi:hypothetical protein
MNRLLGRAEIFRPAIIHSAYAFVLVHNLWAATHNAMLSADLCARCREKHLNGSGLI